MSYALGVDIGTSYTAAAVWRDGRASTVSLADHSDSIPSAILLREDGSLLIGDAAVRRGVLEPDRLARGFKRQIGDPIPLLLGTESMSRTELTGQLLRFVLQKVSAREGASPDHVTLTVPASWGAHHRSLMTEVAAQAGLPDVGLLPEPVAVAIHYAAQQRLELGAAVAIYDLGGGTFDAAVVQRATNGYELRGEPGGDETIGGEDFDDVVMKQVRRSLGNAFAMLDPDDKAVLVGMQQVRDNAIAAKETLSVDVDTTIAVILPGITKQVRLTRAEFQGAIRVRLLRTVDALDRTIASAGLSPAELTAVLLAGGSSQIPLVSQMLVEELGVAVVTDAHPKYAVCLGAALAAASRSHSIVGDAAGPPTQADVTTSLTPVTVLGLPTPSAAARAAGAEEIPGSSETAMGRTVEFRDTAALAVLPEAEVSAAPTDIGITAPADVKVRASAAIRPRLRYLYDSDKIVIDYPGDVRRGGRVLLAAIAVVAVLVVCAVVAANQGWFSRDVAVVTSPPSEKTGLVTSTPPEVPVGPDIAANPLPVTGGPGEQIRGVATIGGGLIGVGGTEDPATAKVWISRGQSWEPSIAPAVPGRVAELTAIAAGPGRPMIAVGWSAEPEKAATRKERRGEIWVSSDGQRWVAATLHAAVGELTAIAALPNGRWMATGQSFVADPDEGDAIVLTSAEGAEWDQLPATGLDGPGPMTVRGVVADPAGGVLGLGARLDGALTRSGLWRSSTGTDWVQDSWIPAPGGAASALGITLDATGRPVLVGSIGAVGGSVPTMWRTEDGALVAHPVTADSGSRLLGAVQAGVGFVLVGTVGGAAPLPAAWSASG